MSDNFINLLLCVNLICELFPNRYNENNKTIGVIIVRKFIKRNEEMTMRNEMRIMIHEHNKYRNCSACRRWKDEFD